MAEVAVSQEILRQPIRRPNDTDDLNHGGKRRKRARPRRKRGKELSKRYATASVRAHQVRKTMFDNGQPVAPYNTTQFLIEDHGDLQNIDLTAKPQRTRDSSFSIDSDDEFFYSSPEDEEEFLSREFSNEYQDLNVERLNSLSKSEIIRDYLLLENRFEKSLIDLRRSIGKPIANDVKIGDSGRDTDASSRSDHDASEQLRLENRRLKIELEKIKRENAHLQALMRGEDVDSVDSESDSSSSTSVSSSSNSEQQSAKEDDSHIPIDDKNKKEEEEPDKEKSAEL